ncbi:hypothetical protein CHX26_15220 [Porphyrobacter sp. HT-58-2]|uniref:glycerophosphoryl diester phosphodiesterase membrane domain-containing protein n=1 Tax=Porphyrobacter sp. HT-58-2 TaxID=2023229 RepID=UPI000CDBF3BB|nr:glycerophosphoryl diester phosphodiesterase membrane domain-containing protein [Porphyrobacter sp. HT-58-2]AUX70667.1 hypothetical protein CHX26_15220 [Porphyrobacter sp. HT-58-2]
MANRKLDMGLAWTQATGTVGANRDLVSVLAGLFLFIPMFVLVLALVGSGIDFGDAGSEPDPERIAEQVNALLLSNWWALLLVVVGQLCGSIAILALLGDRSRPTVREVLGMVPRLILPMLGAQLLVGLLTQLPSIVSGMLPEAAGALLSLVSFPITLYLSVKFSLASAAIVLGHRRNPVDAMRQSWALTKGNSFRLFMFFVMLVVLGMVIGLLLMLVIGLVLAAMGDRVALIGNSAFVAVLVAVFYTLSYALTASIYRQLSPPAPGDDADLFA